MSSTRIPVVVQHGRTWIAISVFAILFVILIARLHNLQVVQGDHFSAMAQRQRMRTVTIPAPRGSILDDTGFPIVSSEPRWELKADPDYMTDKIRATVALSDLLLISRESLRSHFESSWNGRVISSSINQEQRKQIEALQLPGIYTSPIYRRTYADSKTAAQVLGFVRHDGAGGGGLEQKFNSWLEGTPGSQRMQVDARNRRLLLGKKDKKHWVPAHPGHHVQLTLNFELQKKAEESLAKAIEHHQATSGCVIAINPRTGEIKAMASWPTYDITQFNTVEDSSAFRNNAISFVYESGSTMKPLIAGATVTEGETTWDEQLNCYQGSHTFRVGGARRRVSSHAHGILSVAEGIAKSDNILMAQLGLRLGPKRMYEWVTRFGFGRKSGIELPGEDAGIVRSEEKWTAIWSCISVAMGYELQVTPLQMAMVHAAIANRGVWNPPRIIDRMYSIDGETGLQVDTPYMSTQKNGERKSSRLFKAGDALAIQDAMNKTMIDGTGRRLQLDGYIAAGKTGTTEKLSSKGGGYADNRHVGSFVCWAPASREEQPRLLVFAVIDDPKKNGHFGGNTAGPVVKEVLQYGLDKELE